MDSRTPSGSVAASTRLAGLLSRLTARTWLPWLVLVLGLGVTLLLRHDALVEAERLLGADFESHANGIASLVNVRLQANIQVLRGVEGLFNASRDVSRREFRDYVASLRLEERYPGIQGVGFSLRIPAARRQLHEQAIRAEGFPDYAIRPEGEREPYSSIIYLEPFAGRNLRAFGYDMYSEPVRRAAMARALEEGGPALTGRVRLVQETGTDVQNGFLIYVPVYAPDRPRTTLAERAASLRGWAYSPLRMKDFMEAALGRISMNHRELGLDIEIFDQGAPSLETQMYDSDDSPDLFSGKSRYVQRRALRVAGHEWTLLLSSLPAFEARLDTAKARFITGGGVAGSLLLALLTAAMGRAQRRVLAALEASRTAQAELERHKESLEEQVERRTLELRQARDAAEAASRAKSMFLSNVSHELRTPLNAIIGLAHLVQRGGEKPETRDKMERVLEAAHRLLDVLNDIISLSRLDAGEMGLSMREFSLGALMDDVLVQHREAAGARRLHLERDAAPALEGRWKGYPEQIRQVLNHLLDNAIKFTQEGSVRLSVACADEGADFTLLAFEVRDTGIGIRPEDRRHLFADFSQVDGSATRRYGGLGLGLAICRRLASLLGGEIGAESEPGRGSVFRFTCRAHRTGVAERGSPHAASGPDAKATLEHLEELLRRDDLGAVRAMALCRDALERQLGAARAARMREQVERFDFAAALATLEEGRGA